MDATFGTLSGVSQENMGTSMYFMCSWLSLLSDSYLFVGQHKPTRVYRQFLADIMRDGLKSVILRYSALAHEFVSNHRLFGSPAVTGEWIDGFKDTPVFYEYHRYVTTEDPRLAKFIYNFLTFGKKLPYDDPSFETTAFRSWSQVEEKLSRVSYDTNYVRDLKTVLHTLLPSFSIDGFRPRFGPGSVAEKGVRSLLDKLAVFKYDYVVDRFLYHGHLGHYGQGSHLGLSPEKTVPVESWVPDKVIRKHESRLSFVPKDLKTYRSICMEPNTLMYFQQGVRDAMTSCIESSPFSRFIRLRDQAYNRSLAEYGSFTGEIDTIDLSSASDSVSLKLVKKIFPPSWLLGLLPTRSHTVSYSRRSIPVEKFAPMGSAVCFPTQCIIFAGVCILAATYSLLNVQVPPDDGITAEDVKRAVDSFLSVPSSYPQSYRRVAFQPLGVYGDDICVDQRLTQHVMSILDHLGFSVNHAKSFTGSQSFRESCGGYYLGGVDITPCYYRVASPRHHLGGEELASTVALTNAAYLSGYRALNSWLIQVCLRRDSKVRSPIAPVNAVLFVPPLSSSFGIFSQTPRNLHLRCREHSDYQRTERKCITLTYDWVIHDELLVAEPYSYMRWMATAGRGQHDPFDLSRGGHGPQTGGARLNWRWTPVSE